MRSTTIQLFSHIQSIKLSSHCVKGVPFMSNCRSPVNKNSLLANEKRTKQSCAIMQGWGSVMARSGFSKDRLEAHVSAKCNNCSILYLSDCILLKPLFVTIQLQKTKGLICTGLLDIWIRVRAPYSSGSICLLNAFFPLVFSAELFNCTSPESPLDGSQCLRPNCGLFSQ